jgi:osmoprotectant transport system substrate-binding protein
MAAGLGRRRLARVLVGAALTLALGAALSACGGSSAPPLTIGAPETAEGEVLAQIYAQGLEREGFTVRRVVKLGPEPEQEAEALKKHQVSAYPGHLSTPTSFAFSQDSVPADPQQAYRQARADLEREGMTAFPPAPFSYTNLLIALRPTAEELGLKTISDLAHPPRELTVAGVLGCHESINCMEGLEKLYGLSSLSLISGLDSYDEAFKALDEEIADLALVPSTDGRLFSERRQLATLEDDKHAFPAGNPIFVTTKKLAEEAGSGYEAAVLAAQEGLTLPAIQELDAKVEGGKLSAAEAAAEYLERQP